MLLALTITSTIGTVISALAALGIVQQRGAKPPTVVIVVDNVKALTVECQPDRFGEGLVDREELLGALIRVSIADDSRILAMMAGLPKPVRRRSGTTVFGTLGGV